MPTDATDRTQISTVTFFGSGQNSGEMSVNCSSLGQSFFVEADTPVDQYTELFKAVVSAMWDAAPVKILYRKLPSGNMGLVRVERI